jgi:hypothetical protein
MALNSLPKFSSREAKRVSDVLIWLYASTAGIAATRPMAVANNASAMPGATTARLVLCMAAMAEKECMIPQTVPNSPMNGAVAPTLARNTIQRSSRSISRCTVTVIARSIRSRTLVWEISAPATRIDRRHSPMAAANTAAIGLVPSRSNRSSRLPPDQNRSSNPSAALPTLRRDDHFSNTMVQTQMLAPSSPIMTSFTTISACMNRPHSERSPPAAAPRFTASTARSTC